MLATAGSLYVPEWLHGRSAGYKRGIRILHTNDFHSHVDPFPANHPLHANMGGIENLRSLILDNRPLDESFLLLDCGDIFQGTPYFNLFGGVPEMIWMNHAGYHATTLGNHDFDNGVEKLAELLKHANFPAVNCNYDFHETALNNMVKPYQIFKRSGIKIGITGVGIDLDGLVQAPLRKGVVYRDPVEWVQKTVDHLRKKEHCEMIIVLSHLGYQYPGNKIDDQKLAKATNGIDLILGGHTHTFLDEPVKFKNISGKEVIINQAGWAGLRLGKIDFIMDHI